MSNSILNQITEHVYWYSPDETTDRPTLGAIVGKRGAMVVDAGNSPAHANLFLAELAKNGIAPPKYLTLTHWHWDHLFGAEAFNALIFASQETKRVVEEMAQWDWHDDALDKRVEAGIEIEFCRDMMKKEMPDRSSLRLKSPDIGFAQQINIELGDVVCQLIHVGGDHAKDSIVVYVPQDRILFLSDCLYPDLYHGAWNYTTQKLFPLLDKIMSLKADFYLLGHHEAPVILSHRSSRLLFPIKPEGSPMRSALDVSRGRKRLGGIGAERGRVRHHLLRPEGCGCCRCRYRISD